MSLRIGIFGPGGISDDQHAPAINRIPGAQLWSVLSRDRERAKRFAEKHAAAAPVSAYSDMRAMLADPDLDAVIVATPDRLHHDQTVSAAQAGKHVLVEKPMATSVEQAQEMIDACQKNDVTLGIAYHLRWHNGHRRVKKLLQAGQIGGLRHIRMHWTFKTSEGTNWRALPETGRWWSLAANGTHCLDLIRWLMCDLAGEVEEIHATTGGAVWETAHDQTAIVAARFESGATAEFCVSVLIDSPSRIEVYGSDGMIVCDATMGRHGAGEIAANNEPVEFQVVSPFEGELLDFVSAVRDSRSPEVSGEEGLRNVELLTLAARHL